MLRLGSWWLVGGSTRCLSRPVIGQGPRGTRTQSSDSGSSGSMLQSVVVIGTVLYEIETLHMERLVKWCFVLSETKSNQDVQEERD